MPKESPTRIISIPASSMILAVKKSYAVSVAIFSPRCFISRNVWMVLFCSFIAGSPVVLHESNFPFAFRQLPKQHPHSLAGALYNHVRTNCRQRQEHEPAFRDAGMRNDEILLDDFLLTEVKNINIDAPGRVLRQVPVTPMSVLVSLRLLQQCLRRAREFALK